MAKSRTGVSTRRVGGQSIVVVEPPSRPIAQTTRAAGRVTRRRRRSSGGGGGGYGRSSKSKHLMGVAIGGFAYGIIEKSFPTLPTLPIVGKSGTVALAVYFFGGSNELVNDVGIAAAAIAGYSLGKTGVISGGGYDDAHGLAAET